MKNKNNEKKMKIIHIEDYFDPVAGYQINELLYAGKDLKEQVYLITSNDMTPFHKELDITKDKEFEKRTNIKIIRLNVRFKLSTRLILKDLKNQIKSINPEVVFMHGIGDFKDLVLWRKRKEYIIIRDCHMSWVGSKNKFKNLYYTFFKIFFAKKINKTKKYEVIYALGEEEKEYLKKIGIKDEKIEYLPHGYNSEIMYYDEGERKEIRDNYGFKELDIVISYIGKFNSCKRPDILIDIINALDEKEIDLKKLKLLFIGPKEDIYMKKFKKKLEKINKKIKVVIEDSKPFTDLRKYYSATDICIFPKETTLSSIHAQVCCCPVIMENHKSNRERVIKINNLYEKDNIKEAKAILKRIIINKEYEKEKNNPSQLEAREYKYQLIKLYQLVYKKNKK